MHVVLDDTCTMLCCVGLADEARSMAIQAGGVPAILAALTAHTANADISLIICIMLSKMTTNGALVPMK